MNKHLLFLLLFSLASCTTFHRVKSNRLVTKAKLTANNFYTAVPYDWQQNLPIITVEIEGKPYRFFFDTGGYTVLSEQLIEQLTTTRKISYIDVKDGNQQTNRIYTYELEELRIGNIPFQNVGFAKIGFTESEWLQCLGVDGTLGPNIMKQCLWLFESDKQQIILTDQRERLPIDRPGTSVAIKTNNINKPLLSFSFTNYSGTLTFDTGFNGYLQLREAADNAVFNSHVKIEKQGQVINAGHSQKRRTTTLIRLDSINISGLNLYQPIVHLDSEGSSSLLGSEIFKTHQVLFDLANDELVFLPRKSPEKLPSYNTFGFSFSFKNGQITVGHVYVPSAAHTAGLLPGEDILSIDANSYRFSDFCDFMTHFDLSPKEEIVLEVLRAGEPKKIVLKKSALFN